MIETLVCVVVFFAAINPFTIAWFAESCARYSATHDTSCNPRTGVCRS